MIVLPLLLLATAPTLTASLDTTATTVGGRVTMHVDVDAPDGWFVEPPAPPSTLGAFRVRSVQPGEAAGTHRRFDVLLVPTEPGTQSVPAITVVARQGTDAPVELSTPPLTVDVASNLEPPAAADSAAAGGPKPADLKPALEAPRDWRPVWLAAATTLLVAALGFLLLRKLRGRRREPEAAPPVPRKPARPAWEIALEELDGILVEGWVERGEFRRQYEAVTEALRRYLENRWGVPALESTTEDLRALLRRSAVPPEVAGRVLSVLGEADLVKFAKARPEAGTTRAAETRVRAIVLETIPRESPREAGA